MGGSKPGVEGEGFKLGFIFIVQINVLALIGCGAGALEAARRHPIHETIQTPSSDGEGGGHLGFALCQLKCEHAVVQRLSGVQHRAPTGCHAPRRRLNTAQNFVKGIHRRLGPLERGLAGHGNPAQSDGPAVRRAQFLRGDRLGAFEFTNQGKKGTAGRLQRLGSCRFAGALDGRQALVIRIQCGGVPLVNVGAAHHRCAHRIRRSDQAVKVVREIGQPQLGDGTSRGDNFNALGQLRCVEGHEERPQFIGQRSCSGGLFAVSRSIGADVDAVVRHDSADIVVLPGFIQKAGDVFGVRKGQCDGGRRGGTAPGCLPRRLHVAVQHLLCAVAALRRVGNGTGLCRRIFNFAVIVQPGIGVV